MDVPARVEITQGGVAQGINQSFTQLGAAIDAAIGVLLPLALVFEDGEIISKGLSITVIGGVASSALLTLLIVPLAYEIP